MNEILAALTHSYGLDWITMFFGVTAGYLMGRKDKRGIVCNLIACAASFTLGVISHQYGFTVSSVLTMCIMVQAYVTWTRDERVAAQLQETEAVTT